MGFSRFAFRFSRFAFGFCFSLFALRSSPEITAPIIDLSSRPEATCFWAPERRDLRFVRSRKFCYSRGNHRSLDCASARSAEDANRKIEDADAALRTTIRRASDQLWQKVKGASGEKRNSLPTAERQHCESHLALCTLLLLPDQRVDSHSLPPVPKWRNWQTRMVQVHVPARVWGFESLLRHQQFRFSTVPMAKLPNEFGVRYLEYFASFY